MHVGGLEDLHPELPDAGGGAKSESLCTVDAALARVSTTLMLLRLLVNDRQELRVVSRAIRFVSGVRDVILALLVQYIDDRLVKLVDRVKELIVGAVLVGVQGGLAGDGRDQALLVLV